MISSILRFFAREYLITLLTVVAILPAYMAGVITDVASIHLFSASTQSLPHFSSEVARTVGGLHGYPQTLSLGFWFFTIICFQLVAFKSKTSGEFRYRFLSIFLLTWVLYAGFVLTVCAAAILPHGILLSRIDSWLSAATNLVVAAELVVVLILPFVLLVPWCNRST